MDTKYNFGSYDNPIAYVRAVNVTDLPVDVQNQIGELEQVYAVHNADGERLALVRERKLAFLLARQNNLVPVTVH